MVPRGVQRPKFPIRGGKIFPGVEPSPPAAGAWQTSVGGASLQPQRPIEIPRNVVDAVDADADAHQPLRDSQRVSLFRG